ncbi:hypothetical protein C8F04DRAFT_1084798 [Mycena alexandri]|uniref:BTB domain-containing protein n=1 Tax=Mycena alexandri TaxID=1745969 RepID=A0AAD6T5L3_9AGAR|nr:hypothetical protein C8F04DRAFT_1084798 [Mycena alexandri]
MSSPAKQLVIDVMRSEIWYSDGSVVLQVQNTQFRPHDQPTIDGCPVIELQDSVKDVEYLLKALYNPDLFNNKAIPFAYIASFVRLGRKYEFRNLFNIAVERLAFENPTTLKEYDALIDTLKLAAGHSTTRIVDYRGIRQDTLTLARENGLLAILPCAYFRVVLRGAADIFKSTLQPDGTTSHLSCTDHRICAVGLEKVLATQFRPDSLLGWVILWKPTDGCKSVSTCQSWRDSFLPRILSLAGSKVYSLSVMSFEDAQLCESCQEQAKPALIAGRTKFWEDLPSFFDLPPWSELRNDI